MNMIRHHNEIPEKVAIPVEVVQRPGNNPSEVRITQQTLTVAGIHFIIYSPGETAEFATDVFRQDLNLLSPLGITGIDRMGPKPVLALLGPVIRFLSGNRISSSPSDEVG